MTQKDLIDLAAATMNVTKEQAARSLDGVFTTPQKALHTGDGKVPVAGVGTFHVKTTKARTGRNPSTGQPLEIPAKKKVTFKASSELDATLNPEK